MLAGDTSVDASMRQMILDTYARNTHTIEPLKKLLAKADLIEVKEGICRAIGRVASQDLVLEAIDFALDKRRRRNEMSIILSLLAHGHGREQVWEAYQNNFERLKPMGVGMSHLTAHILPAFCTEADAKMIEKFFKLNPLPSAEKEIKQSE